MKKAHRKFVEDGVWRAGGDGAGVKGMGQGETRSIAECQNSKGYVHQALRRIKEATQSFAIEQSQFILVFYCKY